MRGILMQRSVSLYEMMGIVPWTDLSMIMNRSSLLKTISSVTHLSATCSPVLESLEA